MTIPGPPRRRRATKVLLWVMGLLLAAVAGVMLFLKRLDAGSTSEPWSDSCHPLWIARCRWAVCPSTWPFDQGSVMAADTAALSFSIPLAKGANRLSRASAIHGSSSVLAFLRIIVWNRSIRLRAWIKAGTPASMAAMVIVSALLS